MKDKNVTVENNSDTTIWVTVRSEKKRVIETKEHTVNEDEYEKYHKDVVEGSIVIPKLPIKVGTKLSKEQNEKVRRYYEIEQEEKYEWSAFIKEGALEIVKGRANRFSLDPSTITYYITIRNGEKRALATEVNRSEDKIIVDNKGIVDEFEKPKEPTEPIRLYKNSIVLLLSVEDDRYISSAQDGYFAFFATLGGRPQPLQIDSGPRELISEVV